MKLYRKTRGTRARTAQTDGLEAVVRLNGLRAVKMPKSMLGNTQVWRSLRVNSQMTLRRFRAWPLKVGVVLVEDIVVECD